MGAIADIHLHLDGSISLTAAKRLLELGDTRDAPAMSDESLRAGLYTSTGCRDLNEYLSKFDFPATLLQTKAQISECVYLLQEELIALGLAYAELRFAPQRSTWEGLTQQEVVEAALEGLSRSSFDAGLILCCMRGDDTRAANLETVDLAAAYLGKGVVALDLAGAEALFATKEFDYIFARAARLGVPYTIHAGEAAGPESIRAALSFGARRIGHGVRAAEDPTLLAQLARESICCELCPTSNLNTGVYASYKDFPLPVFLEAGVPVTINSDNMSVSSTDVVREMDHMQKTFSLDEQTVVELQGNAIRAAFASDATKASLLGLTTTGGAELTTTGGLELTTTGGADK